MSWKAGAVTVALALGGATLIGVGPAAATHLTSITLDSATVEVGTTAVLDGVVTSTCSSGDPYGWNLSSDRGVMSPSSQAYGGPAVTPFTVTIPTGALAPGVYTVHITGNWIGDGVHCFVDSIPSATSSITVTGRNGAFVCNGVAGRLGPGYMGNSNPAGTPCQDDTTFVKTGAFGPYVTITGATSATNQTPDDLNAQAPAAGDSGTAFAGAAGAVIHIGSVTIVVGAVTSNAAVRCTAWHTASVTSSSRVAGLRINGGVARVVTGYLKINVLGVLVLELNKPTVVGHTRTQQALVISSSLASGKLVIGEATAGYTGTPCSGGVFSST